MSAKDSISTVRPTHEEGLARVRSGDVEGLFATDGICSYAFLGVRDGGDLTVEVTAVTGRTRRQSYKREDIEFRSTLKGWAFVSELDAYLKRERYVRLDPDDSAGLALQIVSKCVRDPLEEFHDRISDAEMMAFNKATLNRVFTVLAHIHDPVVRTHFVERLHAPTNWDPPVIAEEMDPWAGARPDRRPDVTLKRPWRGNQEAGA